MLECGICGEGMLERDITANSRKPLSEIPHGELLLVEKQEDLNVLTEYIVYDLGFLLVALIVKEMLYAPGHA